LRKKSNRERGVPGPLARQNIRRKTEPSISSLHVLKEKKERQGGWDSRGATKGKFDEERDILFMKEFALKIGGLGGSDRGGQRGVWGRGAIYALRGTNH